MKKKGKRITKGSGSCGRKGIKGVEKGDKTFSENTSLLTASQAGRRWVL
jgi:hypothetical protein